MRKKDMQPQTTSAPAATDDALLHVLIDKVVDTGEKIATIKEQISKTIQDEVAEVKGRLTDPGPLLSGITNLQTDLAKYEELFKHPPPKEVHHKHFVGKPLITVLALSLIIVILFACLTRMWNQKAGYAENDLKWKAATQSLDTTVTNSLDQIQQEYNADPDRFRTAVMAEEERRAELSQREARQWEEQQKIQALKNAKKR